MLKEPLERLAISDQNDADDSLVNAINTTNHARFYDLIDELNEMRTGNEEEKEIQEVLIY
tara:strand:+ start:1093 stop:1272 length:180 start_codon:yes stop_codon:yes gene_type:complete